ncbi:hypothetical protein NEDG_00026 [Nematocida displodere]|uniref:GOLD domain-containing protein n=1 Tax=Nematocida displodere TaxID=1805483 RepID=A0A177EJA3_9MICR|nr:hypothetical protein NEDG_00026 [Nematocida displodere]
MKVATALLLLIGSLCATMVFDLPDLKKPFKFSRGIIPHQICKGRFLLETETQGSVNVFVFAENSMRVFSKYNLKSRESVNFSFSLTEGQVYTIQIEENTPIPETNIKILYELTSQYNTFDKKIASSEVIIPALQELSGLEKHLKDLAFQTTKRLGETVAFSDSIGEIVFTILCINFLMFLSLTGILTYQMFTFKDYLKKKKMI